MVTRADLADYQRLRWGGTGQGQDGQVIEPDAAATAAGWCRSRSPGRGRTRRSGPGPIRRRSSSTANRRGAARVTLLSPFDSLIWDRKRTLRMFGFTHSLEAYVPQAKRVHGYYTMPLLAGGRLVGRVDPARSGRTLVARQLSLDKAAATGPMARALTEAAAWVGCDSVELGRVEPVALEPRLRKAISDLT